MGAGKRQQAIRAMRGPMWSPGRPSAARREDRVRFWEAIARGASSEDAAVGAGVAPSWSRRWRRAARLRAPQLPRARYCSFSRRSVRTISMIAWTVSWRAQSRCSSQASETQLIGCPPAWITRSRPARWASRGAADGVDDGVDLIPFAQRVERGEGHADFGPQGADDELAAAGGADGLKEFDVLPGVDRRPVERLVVGQQAGEFGERWLSPAGGDVDGRVHDRDPEGLDGPDRRNGVLDQERVIHRADRGQLRGLVVDEQECGVFRGEEMVGERVAHRGAGHESGTFLVAGLGVAEVSGHQGERLSPDSGDLQCGVSWRTSIRSRPSASISARTPYSADRSSSPVSTVSAPWCCDVSAGNADSTVAPRWPWIRIAYRAGVGSMTPSSSAGR